MKYFIFVLVLALSRWLPMPPNFSPALALVLFSGAQFRPAVLAWALPLVGILLSDIAIGFYSGMWGVYLAYAAVVAVGFWFRPQWKRPGRLIGASFATAVVFFFVSNTGVWLSGELYPRTMVGLWSSLVAGLPFFERSLLSTFVFAAILFKAAEMVASQRQRLPAKF